MNLHVLYKIPDKIYMILEQAEKLAACRKKMALRIQSVNFIAQSIYPYHAKQFQAYYYIT